MTTTTTTTIPGSDLFADLFGPGAEQPQPLPAKVSRTARFTVPDDNGLARIYGAALMEALELLPDEQLCRLAVNTRCQNPALKLTAQGVWLLGLKCEAEAAERWNRAIDCGRQPSAWLLCILRGDLFLPSQLELAP